MERRQICDEGKGGYEQNVTSQTKVQFLKWNSWNKFHILFT
jgi:hypothetical protein